jgi:ATP-dependent RNA helicase DDX56/DBP9
MQQDAAVQYFAYMFMVYLLNIVSRAYQFKLEEVEGFRYRSRDAWRAVTRIAVREARLKEIKQEVLNCEKLKVCF